jgi:hypothetical protein
MKKHKIILLIMIFCGTLTVHKNFGQALNGFVFEKDAKNNKVGLPGVNVFWLGTTKGTFTNDAGKFTLPRSGSQVNKVVVSLMGYRHDTITIAPEKQRIEIELMPDVKNLSEVEISGKPDNTFISKLNAQKTTVITT